MAINLQRFTEEESVLVPIVDGWGQRRSRNVDASVEDGWYIVTFGNKVTVERKATPLEILKGLQNLSRQYVYALGTEGVPVNFDQFKRMGFGEAVRVNFLELPIFAVASVVRWEDNRLYFYEHILPKERAVIQGAKEAFESNTDLLELRGATPELRYYFLLLRLQRESYEALQALADFNISVEQRNRRIAEFQNGFPVRLERAVSQAGGIFKGHSRHGSYFTVEWEVGGRLIKSNIRDDFSVTSAGFCLSGDDQKHTIGSLVQLAKLFQEEAYLNITRE